MKLWDCEFQFMIAIAAKRGTGKAIDRYHWVIQLQTGEFCYEEMHFSETEILQGKLNKDGGLSILKKDHNPLEQGPDRIGIVSNGALEASTTLFPTFGGRDPR